MWRAVRRKKQPRLKLEGEHEAVGRDRGPAGHLHPSLALAYLGQSDTRGSIKRLTRSPARFTSVSWKMADGLGVGGLPSLPD